VPRIIYTSVGPCTVVYRPIKAAAARPNPFIAPPSTRQGRRDALLHDLQSLELIELGVWLATHKTTERTAK
jgi:hypothetical protein